MFVGIAGSTDRGAEEVNLGIKAKNPRGREKKTGQRRRGEISWQFVSPSLFLCSFSLVWSPLSFSLSLSLFLLLFISLSLFPAACSSRVVTIDLAGPRRVWLCCPSSRRLSHPVFLPLLPVKSNYVRHVAQHFGARALFCKVG